MVLSLTFTLSVLTFFTMIAHPQVNPRAAGHVPPTDDAIFFYRQALGVASVLLQTGFLMGIVLLAVRRWRLPVGSLTLIFTLNAVAMSFLDSMNEYGLIVAVALAGLVADLLLYGLKPSTANPRAFRLFAATVPAVLFLFYFITLMLTRGIWWKVHLWAGSIVLAGIVGWLLSYAFLPPPVPEEQPE